VFGPLKFPGGRRKDLGSLERYSQSLRDVLIVKHIPSCSVNYSSAIPTDIYATLAGARGVADEAKLRDFGGFIAPAGVLDTRVDRAHVNVTDWMDSISDYATF
jgi:hypothetical protein